MLNVLRTRTLCKRVFLAKLEIMQKTTAAHFCQMEVMGVLRVDPILQAQLGPNASLDIPEGPRQRRTTWKARAS